MHAGESTVRILLRVRKLREICTLQENGERVRFPSETFFFIVRVIASELGRLREVFVSRRLRCCSHLTKTNNAAEGRVPLQFVSGTSAKSANSDWSPSKSFFYLIFAFLSLFPVSARYSGTFRSLKAAGFRIVAGESPGYPFRTNWLFLPLTRLNFLVSNNQHGWVTSHRRGESLLPEPWSGDYNRKPGRLRTKAMCTK